MIATPCVSVPPFEKDLRFPVTCARKPKASPKAREGHHWSVDDSWSSDCLHWLGHTALFSLTQCACLVIPCGTTKSGLPVSLQLIGRPHSEQQLLAIAALYEADNSNKLYPVDEDPTPYHAEGPRSEGEAAMALGVKSAQAPRAIEKLANAIYYQQMWGSLAALASCIELQT